MTNLKNLKRMYSRRTKSKGFFIFLIAFFAGVSIGYGVGSSATGNRILFTVAYSSEKESWMEQIKQPFLDWYDEHYPERPIKINFFPVGSRESIIAILNGQYQPAIWSPAASTWVPYMNLLWHESRGEDMPDLIANYTTVFYSPIVIAMWRGLVERYNISSIEDIYDLSLDDGFSVRLAHTDPRLSNSGFCTIMMEVSVAANKSTRLLTFDDLLNETVQDWVRQFESTAVLYGKSTGYLMRSMIQSGPREITTAFLYENLIIEAAKSGEARARWGDDVIAIYPAEGSIHSDHPFCILSGADWMTESLLEVSRAFLAFLKERKPQEIAIMEGFRLYNSSIEVSPDLDPFIEENGVHPEITNPKMQVPEDAYFISRVEDLWLLCRSVF
ncbi:MAG: substrate-binding domain-containing protein [Promethearchaeota archaeon]